MTRKIYTTEVKVYTYDVTAQGQKIQNTQQLDNTDTWDDLHLFADPGKMIRQISTGEVLSDHISVGTFDDPADFEEIDAE